MDVRMIQDPVYGGPIKLEGAAVDIVDTEAFQRARRIRQLGYAFLVYPSANHSRFEHMLGAYHVAGRIIDGMRARGEIRPEDEEEAYFARLALLVHDLGHFNGAHLLETHGVAWADHEVAGERWLTDGPIAEILDRAGIPHAVDWIAETIRHERDSLFAPLVAGEFDADGLDYHRRDSYYCFGANQIGFNQDRVVDSLTIQRDPDSGERRIMLHEKGLNAVEQMLWHRYSLYRNIYWHRKVRAASAMARALIIQAVGAGFATPLEIMSWHDEQMFHVLQERVSCVVGGDARKVRMLASRLLRRDLYDVALQVPIRTLDALGAFDHERVERELARHLGLEDGEVLLDLPNKPGMYERNIQVVRKDGSVTELRDLDPEDGFVMNRLGDDLYTASGHVRVFTAEPRTLTVASLLDVVAAVSGAG